MSIQRKTFPDSVDTATVFASFVVVTETVSCSRICTSSVENILFVMVAVANIDTT